MATKILRLLYEDDDHKLEWEDELGTPRLTLVATCKHCGQVVVRTPFDASKDRPGPDIADIGADNAVRMLEHMKIYHKETQS